MYVQDTERPGICALIARARVKSPHGAAIYYCKASGPPQDHRFTAPKRAIPTKFQVHQRVMSTGGRQIYFYLIVNKYEILSNSPTNYKYDAV